QSVDGRALQLLAAALSSKHEVLHVVYRNYQTEQLRDWLSPRSQVRDRSADPDGSVGGCLSPSNDKPLSCPCHERVGYGGSSQARGRGHRSQRASVEWLGLPG